MRTRISSLETAMGLPKGVRVKEFFGRWIFRKNDFRKVVAKETYGLTHEFVLNKLWDDFTNGDYMSAPVRSVLLQLDRDMKTFTNSVTKEDDAE